MHGLGGSAGIDTHHAIPPRSAASDRAFVGRRDALELVERFEAVAHPPPRHHAAQAFLGRKIQHHHGIGRREFRVEGPHPVEAEGLRLVGEARQKVAVGHHDLSPRQRRLHGPVLVIPTIGGEQHAENSIPDHATRELGADEHPDRTVGRLASTADRAPGRSQCRLVEPDLCGATGAVEPLEGDEHAATYPHGAGCGSFDLCNGAGGGKLLASLEPPLLLIAAFAYAAPQVASELRVRAELLALVDASSDMECLTPLVAQLRENWDGFSPAERAHINAVLSPAGSELFAVEVPTHGAAPPPAKDSCWSWSDNRLAGTHFVVEWDDGVSDDDAAQFLEDLEYSWEVEVDERGWDQPTGSASYLMLVYIQNERSGGAYTTVQSCGGGYLPYVVSGKDSWDDPDWGATMAAHEFNHAIQFGYGYSPEFWWWEATATWIEDYVFPDANYWSQYVWGYTANPYIAFAASSQDDENIFWHMYGMAIWAFYLDNYHGGHDTVLETWQDARNDRGQYTRTMQDMVDDLGLDWLTIYNDFAARNTVMDYEQQRYFPSIDLHDTVKTLPADGQSGNNDTPQGYGQNYIKFDDGMGEGDLVVSFVGDDRTEWSVQLVEAKSAVDRVVTATTEDGAAIVTLEGYGDRDVYLVVSPLTDRDSDFEYSWTAQLVVPEVPDDTGEAGNPDGDPDGDPEGGNGVGDGSLELTPPGGCGCDSGGAGIAMAGVAAAAVLAGRRRR